MTIAHGGFAVLSTAWMLLIICAVVGIIVVKKAGRN